MKQLLNICVRRQQEVKQKPLRNVHKGRLGLKSTVEHFDCATVVFGNSGSELVDDAASAPWQQEVPLSVINIVDFVEISKPYHVTHCMPYCGRIVHV
jgi:hypothetical protein